MNLQVPLSGADKHTIPNTYIVEDEPVIRDTIRKSLQQRQITARGFRSAEDFFSAELDHGPHLLVVDKNLPGMSGIDLVDQHRRAGHRFEAILITGYADLESAMEAVRLGFYRYMCKPFDLDELLDHVAGAAHRLQRRAPRTEPVTRQRGTLGSQHALLDRLAHEIDTPLEYLQGNVTFFSQQLPTLGTGPTPEFKALANALLDMGAGTGRLCRVAQALHRVASVDPGLSVTTDVRHLVEAEIERARDRTGFCADVALRLGAPLPLLTLNSSLTRYVLVTCLSELMHAANRMRRLDRPSLTVDCRYARPGPLRLELVLAYEPDPGQDDEAQDDPLQDSSLELVICHSLIAACGGEISGYWPRGGGVALRLAIPAAEPVLS